MDNTNSGAVEAKVELVQTVDGRTVKSTTSIENVAAFMEARGYERIGWTMRRTLRLELQGLPIYKGLAGPAHGGPGVVRYEDSRAYAELSK